MDPSFVHAANSGDTILFFAALPQGPRWLVWSGMPGATIRAMHAMPSSALPFRPARQISMVSPEFQLQLIAGPPCGQCSPCFGKTRHSVCAARDSALKAA